jgi:hypothetical protein
MQDDAGDASAEGHQLARRILDRRFFRVLYERRAEDLDRNLHAVDLVFRAAVETFGSERIDRDTNIDPDRPESASPKPFRFAVEREGGQVVSSLQVSQILGKLPKAVYDDVFVVPETEHDAKNWLRENLRGILGSREES